MSDLMSIFGNYSMDWTYPGLVAIAVGLETPVVVGSVSHLTSVHVELAANLDYLIS